MLARPVLGGCTPFHPSPVHSKACRQSPFMKACISSYAVALVLLAAALWLPAAPDVTNPVTNRYEDNFDAVNNLTVLCQTADKGSIDGYGSPEQFLDKVGYLFGKQTFTGAIGWMLWWFPNTFMQSSHMFRVSMGGSALRVASSWFGISRLTCDLAQVQML